MYNTIECSNRDWELIKDAFRDVRLEMAHSVGYVGNILPDGHSDEFDNLTDVVSVPFVVGDSVVISGPDGPSDVAVYSGGKLTVSEGFEGIRTAKGVVSYVAEKCVCSEAISKLKEAVMDNPLEYVFSPVCRVVDHEGGLTHYFFDRGNFALENFLVRRSDGLGESFKMHPLNTFELYKVIDEVERGQEAAMAKEPSSSVKASYREALFFDGKHLLSAGKLYEKVGRGTDLSVLTSALEFSVNALRERLFRSALEGTEFENEPVRDLFVKDAMVPYYNRNCACIYYNPSCNVSKSGRVSVLEPNGFNSDAFQESVGKVFSNVNVAAVRQQLVKSLSEERSRGAQVRP